MTTPLQRLVTFIYARACFQPGSISSSLHSRHLLLHIVWLTYAQTMETLFNYAFIQYPGSRWGWQLHQVQLLCMIMSSWVEDVNDTTPRIR